MQKLPSVCSRGRFVATLRRCNINTMHSRQMSSFNALIVDKADRADKKSLPVHKFETLQKADLPGGSDLAQEEVLVRVSHSSMNYKDGLVVCGKPGVVKEWPIVPGIDFAGTVEESNSPKVNVGDKVLLTGHGVGERRWGGYAGLAKVEADWLVPLPPSLAPAHAMAVGTAGLTAMMCVHALEDAGMTVTGCNGLPILVTGAGGGVGSLAVAILAKKGFSVAASTGRADELETHLHALAPTCEPRAPIPSRCVVTVRFDKVTAGASSVIPRQELADEAAYRPLMKERFAGGVDSVGGITLSALIASTQYGGAVAACGVAGGTNVDKLTVMPFILRGVRLLGVDSVYASDTARKRVWDDVCATLDADTLASNSLLIPLAQVPEYAPKILKGQVRGRIVVEIS